MSWRPAKSLVRLREQINELAPTRSKASDGTIGDGAHATRQSDHNPWVMDGDVGVVTAIDITDNLQRGCSAQKIVDCLVASRDSRIKYIIWNSQIISASVQSWKWRAYNGKNPHDRHFHLAVKSDKDSYDSIKEWTIT